MLTMVMQRGDEKGRKLDNWVCAAIFILGIIISPWHQLGLGIMQLVIVCACWMLKIRMSQRFAATLHWILCTFITIFISYWAIISPHSSAPSQRRHPHKQVCIAIRLSILLCNFYKIKKVKINMKCSIADFQMFIGT